MNQIDMIKLITESEMAAVKKVKDPEKLKKMAARDKEWGHDPAMTKECQGMSRHYRVCGGCINDLKRKYKNDNSMLLKIAKAKEINQANKK